MTSCSVPGCDSQSKTHPNHKFYRLPVLPDTRERWLRLLGTPESLARTYVCSKHFEPNSYILRRNTQLLSPRAVPTLFMQPPIDEKLKVETSDILVCRVCLAADVRLYGVNETGMEDAFLNLTGAPLTQGGMPSHLCAFCYTELSKCALFRDRCQRAQELLDTLREWGPLKMTDITAIDRHFHNLTRNLTLANVYKFDSNENIVQNHFGLENQEYYNIPSTMPKTKENDDDANDFEFSSKVEDYDGEIEIEFENCAEDTNNPLGVEMGEAIEKKVLDYDSVDITDTMNLDATNFEVLHEETVDCDEEIDLQIDNCEDKIIKETNKVRKESLGNTDVNVSSKLAKVTFNSVSLNIIKKTKPNPESDVTVTVKPKVKTKTVKKTKPQNITRRKVIGGEMYPCFDYEAFEKECMVKIKVYTLEEQKLEVEARKASDNYCNSPYRCEMCGRCFNHQEAFDNHLYYHDPKKGPYECQVCHFHCATSNQLAKHGTKHRISFTCLECGHITWGQRSIARIHFESHRGATFTCPHCDKVHSNKKNYIQHIRFAHSSRNVPCEECGDTFLSPRGLNHHKMLSHRRNTKPPPILKCTTCGVQFTSPSALERHTTTATDATHMSLRPCVSCGENCRSDEELVTHREQCQRSLYCDECDETYADASSYDLHHCRKHLNARRSDQRLNPHNTSFGGCICEICGKVLKNQLMLKYHVVRHKVGKRFPCPKCDKGFGLKSSLADHMRTHTGERPYNCALCSRTFTLPSNLKRHVKVVHLGLRKEFPCEICGKTLTNSSDVRVHIEKVHNKTPYPKRKRSKRKEVKREEIGNTSE